jgi:hypothetical protein
MGRCLASEPCGFDHVYERASTVSFFIVSNSRMWPIRITDQKEESVDMVSQDPIIGIDVSRDWLDIRVLPDDQRQRLPNTAEGHAYLVDIASKLGVIVRFEGYKD